MWSATQALNGLIGAGVPQDWATHMIGHEITVLYGLDHAQTLAIVLPQLLHLRRDAKRAKLLQFAARVWKLHSGTEDERIDTAIAQTRAFFESLGVKTSFSGYGIGAEAVDRIVAQLEAHGRTRLGEHRDIDLATSRRILEACL
jgi:NADP-dependent alcohol dehydrogenase